MKATTAALRLSRKQVDTNSKPFKLPAAARHPTSSNDWKSGIDRKERLGLDWNRSIDHTRTAWFGMVASIILG